jgi:hypothetical protein
MTSLFHKDRPLRRTTISESNKENKKYFTSSEEEEGEI